MRSRASCAKDLFSFKHSKFKSLNFNMATRFSKKALDIPFRRKVPEHFQNDLVFFPCSMTEVVATATKIEFCLVKDPWCFAWHATLILKDHLNVRLRWFSVWKLLRHHPTALGRPRQALKVTCNLFLWETLVRYEPRCLVRFKVKSVVLSMPQHIVFLAHIPY